MTNMTTLAARHSGRPLLMQADAARDLATRLQASVPGVLETESRFDAALRAIGLRGRARRPAAFGQEDVDAQTVAVPNGPAAYCPVWMGEPDDLMEWGLTLKDGIATLNLDTAISDKGTSFCGEWWHGYDSLDAAIRTALADDRVKGIFLRVDSPGGVVAGGLDTLTRTLQEGREAAGGKPIWVYADCAASAAYWISAQADRIIAPRAGLVGSMGAVILHMQNAAALERAGVKVTALQFGAQKTAAASFAELSDEAAADLQAMVDQAGREFVAAVTQGRSQLTESEILATEARVYTAHHDDPARSGVDLKLVDAIMGEADAFRELVAHVSPAPAAAAPAAPAGTPTEAKTGAPTMNKRNAAATDRLAKRQKLMAQLAAIDAEEMEEAEVEEEEEEEEEGSPAASEDEPTTEEGSEPEGGGEAESEDDDESDDADETEDEKRAAAVMGLPEAQAMPAYAASLVSAGLSFKAAKKALKAAARTNAISSRTDTPVNARPAGNGGQASATDQLLGDYVKAMGSSRLRQKPKA